MFMKSLGKPMNAFFSIAYTEEIQPRMTRMTRMKNVKALSSPNPLLPNPWYPRHPR